MPSIDSIPHLCGGNKEGIGVLGDTIYVVNEETDTGRNGVLENRGSTQIHQRVASPRKGGIMAVDFHELLCCLFLLPVTDQFGRVILIEVIVDQFGRVR